MISDAGRALRTLLQPHLPAAAIHLGRPGDLPGGRAPDSPPLAAPDSPPRAVPDSPPRAVGVPGLAEGSVGVPGSATPGCGGGEPAVHLVLCWLREDPDGQQSGIRDVRAEDGTLLGRQAPARRYRLRYLVTASAETVAAEHELLDAVLLAVAGLDSLPPECLPKGLADTGLPVLLRVCAEPAIGSSGIPPCAGFELDVSVPLLPPLQTELAPPAAELAVGVRRPLPQRHSGPAPAGNGRQWRRARVTED